uniref:NADH-ubiquinone oxidoreductase chain 5 n=1 Tax=Euaesthetus ruficapillus TaxID=295609 RepID=A0A0S2M7H0_9COLE|nr:NADH deshydrogenase subunit 5 [Euaesthetus ruficapillus]
MMGLLFLILNYCFILEFELLMINSNLIHMTMLFDWMSLLFMSFVLFISSMVVYYSNSYMYLDKNMNRFILLIFMFVMSMMLMIISPNLISILLGWDGLGLVSYCLVIYYQNFKSYSAGMLTALSNRIGDVALLMSISWMMNYGSWTFYYYIDFMKNDLAMQMISFFIILAAMTKSAQIPFSAWLPAAMAAPTPVSSLVHSSTLVTAGIYLLIRFSNLFNSISLYFMLFISSMTMFMSGLGANFEFDLKKIIALSTLSQLGLMMSILSISEKNLAFFHLLTHALFKATLFMCAGSIIHNFNNCQDIRFMGNLSLKMPITCLIFNISNLSLCGFPFLSGFYSKDLILEFYSMNYINIYMYMIFFISTGLTASYTFRLIYYTLMGTYNFYSLNNLNDMDYQMLFSLKFLYIFVLMGGSMLNWLVIPIPYFICLSFLMKLMTLIVTLIGIMIGILFSNFSLSYSLKTLKYINMSNFMSLMWNLPIFSTFSLNLFPLFLSKLIYKNLDQGWFEYYGAHNIYLNIKKSSNLFQFVFSNNIKIYLLMMVFWIILIMILFI